MVRDGSAGASHHVGGDPLRLVGVLKQADQGIYGRTRARAGLWDRLAAMLPACAGRGPRGQPEGRCGAAGVLSACDKPVHKASAAIQIPDPPGRAGTYPQIH